MDKRKLAGLSLEESFGLLEDIIGKMESREITLEEAFERSTGSKKRCWS